MGKSREGRQSPYQEDFSEPPRPNTIQQRQFQGHLGAGHTHQDDGAGQVAGVERLLVRLRTSDGVDHHVGAEAAGQCADCLHRVDGGGVHGVGGAEVLGAFELLGVDVDGDHRGGTGERGTGDGCHAHAAAADDGDGVAALDVSGVDGRADACHHAAAEQADRGRVSLGVDLGALAGGDEGLLGERADAQRRGELGAVLERHLLGGVVGVEAVLRLAAAARPAFAADGAPVQHHTVAGGHLGDVGADGADDAGGLVAEQEREVVVDGALLVVQVGVADTAGEDVHEGLAGSGIRDQDGFQGDGRVLGADY